MQQFQVWRAAVPRIAHDSPPSPRVAHISAPNTALAPPRARRVQPAPSCAAARARGAARLRHPRRCESGPAKSSPGSTAILWVAYRRVKSTRVKSTRVKSTTRLPGSSRRWHYAGCPGSLEPELQSALAGFESPLACPWVCNPRLFSKLIPPLCHSTQKLHSTQKVVFR